MGEHARDRKTPDRNHDRSHPQVSLGRLGGMVYILCHRAGARHAAPLCLDLRLWRCSPYLVLARDQGDWRGCALIVAALVLGMWWSLAFDAVAKPAILTAIGGWLAWLMVKPEGWRVLVEGLDPTR